MSWQTVACARTRAIISAATTSQR